MRASVKSKKMIENSQMQHIEVDSVFSISLFIIPEMAASVLFPLREKQGSVCVICLSVHLSDSGTGWWI